MQTRIDTGMGQVDALLAGALLKAEARANTILTKEHNREAERRRIREAQIAEQAYQEGLYKSRLAKNLSQARRGLQTILAFAQCEAVQKLIPFQMKRYRRIESQWVSRPEFIFYEGAVCRRSTESDWSPADTMIRIILIEDRLLFEFESEEGWNQEPDELLYSANAETITEVLKRFLHSQSKEDYQIKKNPLLWGGSEKPFLSDNPYFYSRDLVGKILMDCADSKKFEAYCLASLRET